MEKIYYDDNGVIRFWSTPPDNDLHEVAANLLPAGTPYALAVDKKNLNFEFVSVGEKQFKINQIEQEIVAKLQAPSAIVAFTYPPGPVDTDAQQQAIIDAIKAKKLNLLPVTEPFQTQQDIANAYANVDMLRAHAAEVAEAEAKFIPYAAALAQWQDACAKIEAEHYAKVAAEQADRDSEIALLQERISQLAEA